ncbi:hypothetical protein [Deinococcus sp.]|uniref:hypothetical protein n=1 Tax=Deinococcus sp. TaxID=47478 RepID=UPI003B59047C
MNATRLLLAVLGAAMLFSVSAQAATEPFVPAALPKTVKPEPLPATMTDFPALPPGVSVAVEPCRPALTGLLIPKAGQAAKLNPKISRQIQAIVNADQKTRQGALSEKTNQEDAARRQALLPLIGQAVTAQDFFSVALVFQHGNCLQHLELANKLAYMAMRMTPLEKKFKSEFDDPRWLYAATLDRALKMAGKAQKYGTQYASYDNSCTLLYVVDVNTTDQERAELHTPSLKEAIASAKHMKTPGCISK